MKALFTHLQRLDWILIISVLLLVGIGLLSIYSSSIGREDFSNFYKQIIFLGIGFLVMIIISFLDWRFLKNDPYLILLFYFFGILALIGLFFFAPEIRGTRGWYVMGPISIDPDQFVKIILIILLAKYFSTRYIEMYKAQHIFLSAFYIFLPTTLIFFQPDFGSVLILLLIWLGILIVSGIKLRHFLALSFCGLLIFVFSWHFLLLDYQKERIITFIAPYVADPLGAGWQRTQARIAIGAGSLLGQGIGQGSQTQHGFLPEVQTDFIFSSMAEEFGLIGILVLFSLFLILIWRIVRIAILTQTNFSRLFVLGFVILLIVQIFIHIGMNLGLLPIIGVSLPLISYGGSGLIATFFGLGILQSIFSKSQNY
jgi:rod shape determining protein RodA